MIIKHKTEVPKDIPSLAGTTGTTLQWLIAKTDGAKHYAMRLFTVEPAGEIPLHSHDQGEHEIYVVQGSGIVMVQKGEIHISEGDALLIESGEAHGFKNNTKKPLVFICVIPL